MQADGLPRGRPSAFCLEGLHVRHFFLANRAAALALTALALLAATPAQALFGDDEARKAILDLRAKSAEQDKAMQQRFDSLQAEIARVQRNQLDLVSQIEALKQEIAKLRGQNEALTNEVAILQKRSRDVYVEVDGRLKSLEPKPVTLDGRSVTIGRDEQGAYDAALVLFRAGDFQGAIRSLQTFLVRYPGSVYVPSAHYWIGNAYYALKDYKNAIASQQVVTDRFADTPRAPEALLNIAASQDELKQRTAARATLQKLIKEYPDSESAKVAKERLAAMGAR
jgi:tol-pal system protein YbgF